MGITHVLNTAEGSRFGQVDTGHVYYRDTQIRYMGFPLTDHPSTDISRYFYIAAKFIDNAISSGGQCLTHTIFLLDNIHDYISHIYITITISQSRFAFDAI